MVPIQTHRIRRRHYLSTAQHYRCQELVLPTSHRPAPSSLSRKEFPEPQPAFRRSGLRHLATQRRSRPYMRIEAPSMSALGEALSRYRTLSKAHPLWSLERDADPRTGDFFLRLHLLRHKPRRIFGFWEGSLGSRDIWAVRRNDPVVHLPCSDGGYPWTYV